MTTLVPENSYQYSELIQESTMIKHTNSTTRKLLYGELVCVIDANDKYFIGIVKSRDGIAASGGVGVVDLVERKEISTTQFTAATFVPGNVTVYVTPQTNDDPADIKLASAEDLIPLDALVISYHATNGLRLRMPPQTGTTVAVPAA